MAKGISREAIVAAGLELLDENGIDAVTARALAARLGVRAPALYWHMGSKQEILDEMGTEVHRRVVRAMAEQQPGLGWREGLAGFARVLRREYLAYHDGARTFSAARITDPEVLRSQEPWIRRWCADGLPLEQTVAAAQLVTAFVVGFVIKEQERAEVGTEYVLTSRDETLARDLPIMAEAGRLRFDNPDERFEKLLGMLLDGVAAGSPDAGRRASGG